MAALTVKRERHVVLHFRVDIVLRCFQFLRPSVLRLMRQFPIAGSDKSAVAS